MLRYSFLTHPLVIGIAVITFYLYISWNGLYSPLLLDDQSVLGTFLVPNFKLNESFYRLISSTGPLGRPVSMLSFILNAQFSINLYYWKLTNLLLHILCGILIYFLTKGIYTNTNPSDPPQKAQLLALIVAIFWLIHPLHISTVFYTVQRMTQLATLFTLAGMLSYFVARQKQQESKPFLLLQFVTWFILFPLAIFSKETALLYPAFIILFEIIIFQNNLLSNKQLFIILSSIILVTAGLITLNSGWLFHGYNFREFTLVERLLTEPRIIVSYIGMLLLPAQNRMGFLHDDIEISQSLLTPWTTLPAIVLIAGLIILSLLIIRRQPILSLGILFFFTGHILESTIFPLELMFEHRNYLPSIGLILSTVTAVDLTIKNRYSVSTLAFIMFSLFIFVNWQRAAIWSSPYELYYYMEIHHPNSKRLASLLSKQASDTGNYQLARNKLSQFNDFGTETQLKFIDCQEYKTLDDHQIDPDKLIQHNYLVDNHASMQLIDIANLGLDNKCSFSKPQFLKYLNKILITDRLTGNNRQLLMMYKAHYEWELSQTKQAILTLRKIHNLNTNNLTPLFLACEWSLDKNLHDAEALCNEVLNKYHKSSGKYYKLANKVSQRLSKN